MNIYIVGYPCCGKTSLGKKIAKKIGYNFVDLDHLFEEEYKITIPDFFEKYSEEAFRMCERKILHSTTSLKNTIIATGGGTPCYFDNMEFINKNGTSIYLQRCVGFLTERLKNTKQNRPLLQNISTEEMPLYIEKQLSSREAYYLKSHIVTSLQSPIKIVELIKETINID
jgi:shikimate kinase